MVVLLQLVVVSIQCGEYVSAQPDPPTYMIVQVPSCRVSPHFVSHDQDTQQYFLIDSAVHSIRSLSSEVNNFLPL